MVSLTKSEKEKLKEILSKSEEKEAKTILDKLNKEKRVKYAYTKEEILALLKKAFKEEKKVKIKYYSPTADEVTRRVIAVYNFDPKVVTCYCYLREEESVQNNRICKSDVTRATRLKDWTPENKVW